MTSSYVQAEQSLCEIKDEIENLLNSNFIKGSDDKCFRFVDPFVKSLRYTGEVEIRKLNSFQAQVNLKSADDMIMKTSSYLSRISGFFKGDVTWETSHLIDMVVNIRVMQSEATLFESTGKGYGPLEDLRQKTKHYSEILEKMKKFK